MPSLKVKTIVIAILALLLALLMLHALSGGILLMLWVVVMQLCPCVSAECQNCSCGACVQRLLVTLLLVVTVIPLLIYLRRGRKYKLR